MGISVGSVSVDIVPDTTNFRRELNAKLKDLSVQVRADLDDRKFKTELDAATRDRTVDVKVDDHGSINQAQGRSHALLTTLGLLAPAVAPLTAVAIGGTVALGALGATGLLAFKGIENAMKDGTPVGRQYSRVVQTLQGDLQQLEKTAATGVLAGLTHSTELLHGSFPELQHDVAGLAQSLGSDLVPLTDGLLSTFRDLQPTIGTISGGIHSLAVDFQTWADGPGGVRFANYLATELPVVVHTLEALGSAGAHVVSALLPLGGPVLGSIRVLSSIIAHLPVGVVQDLYVAFLGYKVVTLASAATTAFNGALKSLGLTAGATAAKMDVLAASEARAAAGGGRGGIIGRIGGSKLPIAGAGGFLAAAGAGILAGAAGANIIQQHGAGIDNAAGNQIAAGGVSGFNAQVALQKQQQAQLASLVAQQQGFAKSGNESAALALTPKIQQQQTAVLNLAKALTIARPLVAAVSANNRSLGLTALGTKAAVTGETVALQKWITTSDKLATAAQGVVGANIAIHQAISDANKSLKENGKTLDLNTQKGRNNATALLGIATATHVKIDADAAGGKSQKTINADFANGRAELVKMAEKFGLGKTAANNYAKALLGIPNNVLTTVTVNGLAKSAAQIAALKKAEGSLQFFANQKQARGGLLDGPGTGTSDSIPIMASKGEFIVNAKATAKNQALLHKINSSTPAFAGGGLVGYAAGGQVVDANLSAISSLLNTSYATSTQVASARTAEARATATLAGAEATLQHLRSAKHPDAARIHAEEARIVADRLALAAATSKLAAAEKSYAASKTSLVTKFANASASTARSDAGFLANLNKLNSLGFGFLAQELLAEGDATAMQVAAEAVKWSNSKLSSLQKSLQSDAATQAQLQNLAANGFGPHAAAAPAPVQVTQNITTQAGMSNTAIGNISAGQLAMALAR